MNAKGLAKPCTVSDLQKVVSMIPELLVIGRLGSSDTRERFADSLVNQAGP